MSTGLAVRPRVMRSPPTCVSCTSAATTTRGPLRSDARRRVGDQERRRVVSGPEPDVSLVGGARFGLRATSTRSRNGRVARPALRTSDSRASPLLWRLLWRPRRRWRWRRRRRRWRTTARRGWRPERGRASFVTLSCAECARQLEDFVLRRNSTVAELAQLEGDLLEQAMSTGVISPVACRSSGGESCEEGKRRFLLCASGDGSGREGGGAGGPVRPPPHDDRQSPEKAARNARWMNQKEVSASPPTKTASPSVITAAPPVFTAAELAAAKQPSEDRLIIVLCGSDEAAAVRAVAPRAAAVRRPRAVHAADGARAPAGGRLGDGA